MGDETDQETEAEICSVQLRSCEIGLMESALQDAIETYREKSLSDEAAVMESVRDSVPDSSAEPLEVQKSDLELCCTAFREFEDTRLAWFRSKIARRAQLSPVQMGFTTTVPFMSMVTQTDPTRPE